MCLSGLLILLLSSKYSLLLLLAASLSQHTHTQQSRFKYTESYVPRKIFLEQVIKK
jgi:hypothetical protein